VLAFLSIIVVAFCGLVGAPVWCLALGAIALVSISYARHHLLFRRADDLGLQGEMDRTLIGSLVNALVASTMAYGCGAALRFLSVGWQ
jgi:hypothetical protein